MDPSKTEASERTIVAPFTEGQVASLSEYQACAYFHPFTCSNGCHLPLKATADGWECPGGCGYGQNWAHRFMGDWAWKKGLKP